MASWPSKIVRLEHILTKRDQKWASAASVHSNLKQQDRRPPQRKPPVLLTRGLTIGQRTSSRWPICALAPRDRPHRARVVYLHGGGYLFDIEFWQWRFAALLAREANAMVDVVLFPRGLELKAADAVARATDLTADAIAEDHAMPTVLMGDSAGGGFALAVAQQLRDRGVQPDLTVLLYPWLDATLSDPRQPALEKLDHMLAIPGMHEAAKIYGDGLPAADPRLSPLFGDLTGLAPIMCFAGTHDIVYPDSPRLVDRAREAGIKVELYAAAEGQHGFAMAPTPEGRYARKKIVEAIAQRL